MSNSKPVTASTVRDYFAAKEARVESLPEAARKSIAAGARGRLHPSAIKAFNAKRKTDRRYVSGAGAKVKAAAVAQREALRDAGLAGARGPLSKDAKAYLAQPKG